MTKESKRRGRSPSLRNRILAIALVPSLVLVALGGAAGSYLAYQGFKKRDFATRLTEAGSVINQLMAGLQEERRLTIKYVVSGDPAKAALVAHRARLDAGLNGALGTSNRLAENAPEEFDESVRILGEQMEELPRVRQRVDRGQSSVQDVDTTYSQILAVFVTSLRELSGTAPDAEAAYLQRSTADLVWAGEAIARSRALATAAISKVGLSEQQVEEYLYLEGSYHELLEALAPSLGAAEREQYEALVVSPAWEEVEEAEEAILASLGNRNEAGRHTAVLPIDEAVWDAAAADTLRQTNALTTAQTSRAAEVLRADGRDQLVRLLLIALALLLVALAAFAVSVRLSTNLIGRLVRLREDTLALATVRLPAMVERLRGGEKIDVAAELPPLDHGKDEIGQVADAFNRAQHTAVAAAAQEAETRAGTGKVFLNIAHRSQVIVHRQLKVLDQAERAQEDPEQLNLLFQLDHLATRARRNAENLIILGGGQPGRQWRNPVPLLQVARSAIGEAETYVRVSVGSIPDIAMEGAAVADLVHLLAELVDNATNFSPPTARVEVRSNLVGRGVVVEIEDQGLGIEPEHRERLNELLHNPPDFSVMALSDEPRLGLFVVARLAVRHGIQVTLLDSPAYGGTRAVVLIPSSLVAATTSLPADGTANGETSGTPMTELPGARASTGQPTTGPVFTRQGNEGERRALLHEAGQLWPDMTSRAMRGPASVDTPAAIDLPRTDAKQHAAPPTAKPLPEPLPELHRRSQSPEGPVTGERPALPRRTRQANLVPQLREETTAHHIDLRAAEEALPEPEHARDRFAAFQRGTRQARDTDPGATS